jgi:hypothetical protein
MSSRHTPIKGVLTRSFGEEESRDLVVSMHEEGYVSARYEPTDRKLKRGEKLEEARISIEDLWELRDQPTVTEAKVGEVESVLNRILTRLPVADFGSEELGKKVHYQAKAWLWQQLKQEIDGIQ